MGGVRRDCTSKTLNFFPVEVVVVSASSHSPSFFLKPFGCSLLKLGVSSSCGPKEGRTPDETTEI